MATSQANLLTDLGTSWVYGTSATKPKQSAIDLGTEACHQVFLERVTKYGRQFGSYDSIATMVSNIGTTNHHLFEILPVGMPVKMYFDIDYVGTPDELDDILIKATQGSSELLGITVDATDFRISCGSGIGETSTYKNKIKQSYHIVLDNQYAFPSVRDVRAFVDLVFSDDQRVDKVPYQKNQSFKLINQSKFGSARVQLPTDEGHYQHHMVTAFRSPPSFYNTERLQTAVATTVRQQVIRPHVIVPEVLPFVGDDLDIFSVRTLLNHLPNSPIKQPFQVYMTVACICRNEDEQFDALETWASQAPKYNRDKCLRLWNSLSKRLDGYNIRTLQAMVSECNPSLFKTMQDKVIHQNLHPTIDLAAHNISHVQYSEPRMEPWLEQSRAFKHILVRGSMGSGKTHQLRESIMDLKPASVLVVTPRQLFARSMLGTLREALPDLQLYKEIPHHQRDKHNFMVCQLESLWSLTRTYEMVILDECESIMYQFSSPTIKHFEDISEDFERLVAEAKTVFWSDAFLQDRSILACHQLDPTGTKVFIQNHYIPTGRRAYNVGSYGEAKEGLKMAAQHLRAESNACVSASKQLAKELKAILEEAGPTILIDSDTSDDIKAKLEHVNDFLPAYRHFVYTGAITVGTSYDKKDHFDNLLMYTSACSNNVRDSMQASMRVRHIKSGNLLYGSYPRYFGSDRFDVFSRGRLQAMIEGREQYKHRRQTSDTMFERRSSLPEWQKTLWVHNTAENNVSAFLHTSMVEAYLELCGYELMGHKETSMLDAVDVHVNAMNYHEIPDVNACRYAQLGKLLESGAATTNDKLGWLKGTFTLKVIKDPAAVEPDVLSEMFENYARKKMGIQGRLSNKRLEQKPEEMDHMLSLFQDNQAQKHETIKSICEQLGISASYAIGEQIRHAVLDSSCEKVLAMKKELQRTFDLRLQEKGKKDTLKRGLEVLNGIWHKWGFTEIAADGPRKQARGKGGKRRNITDYVVRESPGFNGFARFT